MRNVDFIEYCQFEGGVQFHILASFADIDKWSRGDLPSCEKKLIGKTDKRNKIFFV